MFDVGFLKKLQKISRHPISVIVLPELIWNAGSGFIRPTSVGQI